MGVGPESGAGGSRDGPLGRGRRAGRGQIVGVGSEDGAIGSRDTSLERGVASKKGRGQIVGVGTEDWTGRWGGGGAAGVEP